MCGITNSGFNLSDGVKKYQDLIMKEHNDVTVRLPAEYFGVLSEAISIGLQRIEINPRLRQELLAWWEAEREFIKDEIND